MYQNGIFFSKLSYCLAVYGKVKGLNETYREATKIYGLNALDINRLQGLQISVNGIITGARRRTPTAELLKDSDSLSVMQLIALHTVTNTGRLKYLACATLFNSNSK